MRAAHSFCIRSGIFLQQGTKDIGQTLAEPINRTGSFTLPFDTRCCTEQRNEMFLFNYAVAFQIVSEK